MKLRPFFFSLFALLIVCLFATRSLWGEGLVVSFDMEFHAARTANYYLALKQGQFPPRWAPNLNSSFGYPVFLMVYPLPYLLTTPIFIATKSVETSVNLVTVLAILAGATGMWFVAVAVTRRAWVGLMAGLLYGLAPYALVTVFVKGAVAESLFIGSLPWVWLALVTMKFQKKIWWQVLLFCSLFSLFLAHHISLMVIAPVIVVWLLFRWWPMVRKPMDAITWKNWWAENWPLVSVGFLSVCAVCFFWIPLLAEKQFTMINHSTAVVNYRGDFVKPYQLFWSNWGYAGGTPGGVKDEKFTLMVGVSLWGVVAVALYQVWQRWKKKTNTISIDAIFWLVTFFVSIFLMLSLSIPVWEVFSPLKYIQFPWRLLWLAALSATMLYIYLERDEKISSFIKKPLYGAIIVFAVFEVIFWAKPIGYFSHDTYYWLEYPLNSVAYDELRPQWFDNLSNFRLTDQVALRPAGQKTFLNEDDKEPLQHGEVQVIDWNGSQMTYTVKLESDGDVLQRTTYFPGWEAKVDGQFTPINYQDKEFPGRIIIPVKTGEHTIDVRFTNNTIDRKIGDGLSIFGLAGFAGLMLFQIFTRRSSLLTQKSSTR